MKVFIKNSDLLLILCLHNLFQAVNSWKWGNSGARTAERMKDTSTDQGKRSFKITFTFVVICLS